MFSIAVIALCLTVVAAGPQWMALQPSNKANEVKDSALKFEPAQIFQEFEKVWEDFKSKHSKSYEDKEEIVRKDVFKTNLKRVELHNYLHSKGEKSFTVGTNEYSDMKHSEFVSVMNGYKTPASNTTRRGMTYMSPNVPVTLPDTKDWRTEGYVTPVKNQGHCGSCWSFSTTGSLEGQHFRRSQKLVSLSEQNLVDCSAKWGNNGCNGGLMDNAFQYIEDNDGIDTEESYPYKAKQGKCHFKSRDIGATDLGFTDTPEGDEDKLKEALATVGPISIAIDASHPSFQMYKEGVYDEPECSSTALDHGVLIVGYGTSEEGADYWLVKNSWGPTWGLDGYIKMSRNKENQCGVASKASYPNV